MTHEKYWIASHLAFLVQWLRVLGIDVRLWDKEVVFGREEEEAVVQWDRYPLTLSQQRIRIISLSASTREALLKEFFVKTGIQPDPSRMFTRCLRCNSLLLALNPEEAKNKWPDLPVYVFQTQKHFNWCDRCQQLFWAGTHVRNMIRTLEGWGIIPDPNKS
jgi:uncharacterized protein with PIN domain